MRMSSFHHVVRQLVCVCRALWKMRGKKLSDLLDAVSQCGAEFFVLKVGTHLSDYTLPELLAALFVDRLITNNSELVRARRYKNQHGVALPRLVHSQLLKFFLRNR